MFKLNTKEKILKACLSIINEYGFEKATVRNVAKKAGVNIASINYHFRNKRNMVNESLNVKFPVNGFLIMPKL